MVIGHDEQDVRLVAGLGLTQRRGGAEEESDGWKVSER
jgi:hypothetical protein